MNSFTRIQPPLIPVQKLNIPDPVLVKLSNGVPLYLIESGNEDILRIEFSFKAGKSAENVPLLASTTNVMLKEGSENYSSEELNSLLDYYGTFLSLSIDKDRAGISFYLLSRHIDKILELCNEIIFRPIFPLPELNALMKKRIQWYLVNREKVKNLASEKFFESIFGKAHPYGYQITEENFGKMNPDLLVEFHSMYYTPGNMAIIVSGKIDKELTSKIDKHFGTMPSQKPVLTDNAHLLKEEISKKEKISKPEAVQAAIRIGSATINKRHKDYTGLKVVDALLGGYFGSRLMKNIREEKGYTYGIGSSLSSLDLSGYTMISTEVNVSKCQDAISEIYKEISTLQTKLVEKNELEVVRNYLLGEMVRMFDGPFALAESFKAVWEFGLDNSYYHRLADKIKTIEADEILSLALTYYNINDLHEITAGEV